MIEERVYLRLPEDYSAHLGDMRWSETDNSLDLKEGGCGYFAGQVADFLEGFGSVRSVPHFAHVVHLLTLLGQVPPENAHAERRRLWRGFVDSGSLLRNAGAFCAHLCASLPDGLPAEALRAVCAGLRTPGRLLYSWIRSAPFGLGAEVPPLQPADFEAMVLRQASAYPDEDLRAWFRTGRGPLRRAGESLARLAPVSLAARLAAILERPRLAGAATFLAQLSSATALPPRRLHQQHLPMGGYADVTTRGQVDRIVPSQFALEELDFLRRLAEGELLYFRREDPQARPRQALVLLFDQGVRTWGDVRLVLVAAVQAFGRWSIKRRYEFFVATTGRPRRVDPRDLEQEAFDALMEASDLSPHPGLALESLLEEPQPADRDLVLLTHPRNLAEPDVRSAARRLRANERLFALAVERGGRADLVEMKRGVPITLQTIRVDMDAVDPITPPAPRTVGWAGDVEPVPFPFRFGTDQKVDAFDFDGAGRQLLTAGPNGLLHLWNRDGTLAEMLPRGVREGKVLDHVQEVIGVRDGFVVIGFAGRDAGTPVAHYHRERRRCSTHLITGTGWRWEVAADHHCLIATDATRTSGSVLDLGTGERFSPTVGGANNRARQAWEAWANQRILPRRLGLDYVLGSEVRQDPATGRIEIRGYPTSWGAPFADGRPIVRQHGLSGVCRGSKLVLVGPGKLELFGGPDGVHLGECPHDPRHPFALSPDGNLLARYDGKRVRIGQADAALAHLGRTHAGGFHPKVHFALGHAHLFLQPGGDSSFLLSWETGELVLRRSDGKRREERPALAADSFRVPLGDRTRWRLAARGRLLALGDRYGQVALFAADGSLAAMFFAFRRHAWGWLPDGTMIGPLSLSTRVHGEVRARFGRALAAACEAAPSSRSVGGGGRP